MFSPICKYQKGRTRLAASSDKVHQLLAHDRWFSPGSPDSSTTKTRRHDMAESSVKHNKSNKIKPTQQDSTDYIRKYLQFLCCIRYSRWNYAKPY